MAERALGRGRLVLGRYAQRRLPGLAGADERRERALDYLYSREYHGRGLRKEKGGGGSLDPSQVNIPGWLGEVRELFLRDTCEVIEKHALDRYGLTELLTDPRTLEK